MVLVHVKYGEASMAPAVFNPDCDSATLLDYVRRRAVKDTEAYARQADARVSAFVGEVANDLARARASFDRINRGLEGEVDAEDEAAVAERAEATAAAEAAAAKVARLEELEKVRTAQKDALINGVGLFKGLDAVDLQEEGGAALNLRSDPKRNARTSSATGRRTSSCAWASRRSRRASRRTGRKARRARSLSPRRGRTPTHSSRSRSSFRRTPWSRSRSPPRSLLPRRGRSKRRSLYTLLTPYQV